MKNYMFLFNVVALVGSISAMQEEASPASQPLAVVTNEPAVVVVQNQSGALAQLMNNPATKEIGVAFTVGIASEEISRRYFGFDAKKAGIVGLSTAAVVYAVPKITACIKSIASKKTTDVPVSNETVVQQ